MSHDMTVLLHYSCPYILFEMCSTCMFITNVYLEPNLLILFSMVDSLRMISLEIDEIYDVELPIVNAEFPNMGVLDWDSKSDQVFWADSSQETINSVSISVSSTKSSSVLEVVSLCFSLFVDSCSFDVITELDTD